MKRFLRAAAIMAVIACIAPTSAAQSPRSVAPHAALQQHVQRLTRPLSADVISLLDERQDFTWEGVGWQLQGRSVYTYDNQFRIEEIQYEREGGAWVPAFRMEYSGNDFNHVTATEQWDAVAGEYVPLSRTDYNYAYDTSTGEYFVLEELHQVYAESEWVDDERTVYTIDENFTVTGSETDGWTGAAWEPIDRTTLSEADDRVFFVLEEWDGAQYVNVERIMYYYPTINELYDALRELQKETANFEGLLYLLGRLPATETQEWNGTAWVNVGRSAIYYDLFTGRRLHTTFDEWADDKWATTSRLAYTYDGDGIISSTGWEANAGEDVWETIIREDYTWDEEGSIASVWQSVDLGGGLTAASKQDYFWRHLGSAAEEEEVPSAFVLEPAYPNPFNPSTRIEYAIGESGPVTLRVFDGLGREVATLVDGVRAVGTHQATFEAAGLPSGLYLVRLETANGQAVRTVTLLK